MPEPTPAPPANCRDSSCDVGVFRCYGVGACDAGQNFASRWVWNRADGAFLTDCARDSAAVVLQMRGVHIGAIVLSPCCKHVLLVPAHSCGEDGVPAAHAAAAWAFPSRPSHADTSIHHAVAITSVREVAGIHISSHVNSHWWIEVGRSAWTGRLHLCWDLQIATQGWAHARLPLATLEAVSVAHRVWHTCIIVVT